jgi:4-hydroxyphenylpyruvate dioxygenase
MDMAELFDNPMGLDGFEFVEFCAPAAGVIEPVFETLGFSKVAVHRSKDVVLYRHGGINFVVNREPKSLASYFAEEHDPSACGLAFRVANARTLTVERLSLARSQSTFQPVRWNSVCLPSRASVAHRCI